MVLTQESHNWITSPSSLSSNAISSLLSGSCWPIKADELTGMNPTVSPFQWELGLCLEGVLNTMPELSAWTLWPTTSLTPEVCRWVPCSCSSVSWSCLFKNKVSFRNFSSSSSNCCCRAISMAQNENYLNLFKAKLIPMWDMLLSRVKKLHLQCRCKQFSATLQASENI